MGVDVSVDEFLNAQKNLKFLLIRTLVLVLGLVLGFGIFVFVVVRRDDKYIHKALEIRNEELQSEVKKRTSSLEVMMSAIVHELRAPLTAMKWGLQSLTEIENEKERESFSSELQLQSEEMVQIVNQLLDVSRLELGKFEVKLERKNVVDIVRTVVSSMKPLASSKNLTLMLQVEDHIPDSDVDELRLKEVVTNLVSNAIKYTQKGGIVVKVLMANGHKAFRVEVTDTGIGLTKEAMRKLFEPFERHAERGEVSTGLGLFITKGIVNAHAGTINVQTKKGKGSTFWFEIPCHHAEKA